MLHYHVHNMVIVLICITQYVGNFSTFFLFISIHFYHSCSFVIISFLLISPHQKVLGTKGRQAESTFCMKKCFLTWSIIRCKMFSVHPHTQTLSRCKLTIKMQISFLQNFTPRHTVQQKQDHIPIK